MSSDIHVSCRVESFVLTYSWFVPTRPRTVKFIVSKPKYLLLRRSGKNIIQSSMLTYWYYPSLHVDPKIITNPPIPIMPTSARIGQRFCCTKEAVYCVICRGQTSIWWVSDLKRLVLIKSVALVKCLSEGRLTSVIAPVSKDLPVFCNRDNCVLLCMTPGD